MLRITKHTPQVMVLMYHIVPVELFQRAVQPSPDAKTVSKYLSEKIHCSIVESLRSPHGNNNMLQEAIEKLIWIGKHN